MSALYQVLADRQQAELKMLEIMSERLSTSGAGHVQIISPPSHGQCGNLAPTETVRRVEGVNRPNSAEPREVSLLNGGLRRDSDSGRVLIISA